MTSSLSHSSVPVASVSLLGCTIHAVTAATLTDLLEEAVASNQMCIIANHNLHSLYLYQRNAKLREFFAKATWTHADGMGVILLARAAGAAIDRSSRVTYVDWLPMVIERAEECRWRVFYLGAKPGVAARGFGILLSQYPELQVETAHGYFNSQEENDAVVEKINRFAPDVLLVGMGMPRQECWIADNYERLRPTVLLPCGASIDYVAGEIPTPPRWAGQYGLEWFYRLVAEPSRLWQRYLVEPWGLMFLVGVRWLRGR